MWHLDLDDDKIFLQMELLYARYKIGIVRVGADGKPKGVGRGMPPERLHCRVRSSIIRLPSSTERCDGTPAFRLRIKWKKKK